MMKHEFYYTSRDSVTKIHAIEWLPDIDIKGVLQICHGMVEYIDRYDEFAEFMSEHGYYVVGHVIWDMGNPYRQKLIWDILMNGKVISM